MLQDEITLDLEPEVNLLVNEEHEALLDISDWAEPQITIDNTTDYVVYLDIDAITAAPEPGVHDLYGKVARIFTFGKSVFGRIDSPTVNVIGYGEGDYGAGEYPGRANVSFNIGFRSTTSVNIGTRQTAVADVSLSAHGVPNNRGGHVIKVRARTLTGITGRIKAALYEGNVNRSGDLITSPLTNALADYDLPISTASALAIVDYSNLSIRFWGYDPAGNALVFEVANVYLELPTTTGSVTQYGSISRVTTFNRAVAGNTVGTQTPVAEISLSSHGTPVERTHHAIKVRARTTARLSGVIRAALYQGSTNRSGDLNSNYLTNVLADYTLAIPDAAAATITDYSNLSIRLWGFDYAGNPLIFEVAKVSLELPVASGATTYYGVVSRVTTFTKAVSGITNKKTAVAEVSLHSHGTPSVRVLHKIKVRARTTTGSTGKIRAALYEGATKRSGTVDLETGFLTNSLADYTLSIPDADAATITSYSNLSIRFWGFDSAGNALTFQVANIYLELPIP